MKSNHRITQRERLQKQQRSAKSASAANNVGANGRAKPLIPEQIDIDLLQPYPGNDQLYTACSAEADAMLRKSMETEGQRDPIHVLPPHNSAGHPDYTILDGHRRTELRRGTGAKTVTVIIRHDLAAAGASSVHQVYLSFNRDRRQLDGLSLARNLREQQEATQDLRRLSWKQKQLLTENLSRLLGTTYRNASRYAHGVHAPDVVQAAHRHGHLGLDDLARVGMQPAEVQEEIAQDISAPSLPIRPKSRTSFEVISLPPRTARSDSRQSPCG